VLKLLTFFIKTPETSRYVNTLILSLLTVIFSFTLLYILCKCKRLSLYIFNTFFIVTACVLISLWIFNIFYPFYAMILWTVIYIIFSVKTKYAKIIMYIIKKARQYEDYTDYEIEKRFKEIQVKRIINLKDSNEKKTALAALDLSDKIHLYNTEKEFKKTVVELWKNSKGYVQTAYSNNVISIKKTKLKMLPICFYTIGLLIAAIHIIIYEDPYSGTGSFGVNLFENYIVYFAFLCVCYPILRLLFIKMDFTSCTEDKVMYNCLFIFFALMFFLAVTGITYYTTLNQQIT